MDLSSQLHGPVIIVMIAVRMVQPAVHKIVNMVGMRHQFMSAIWTERRVSREPAACMSRDLFRERDDMFVRVTPAYWWRWPS